MDKVLLAVVALGLGFLLWQIYGEIRDLKADRMVNNPVSDIKRELHGKIEELKAATARTSELVKILEEERRSPVEPKPCTCNLKIAPSTSSKKVLPPPLILRPSLAR